MCHTIPKKVRLSYKSKHNFKHKNQVILLMVTNGKKWHYLAVKSFSVWLRGITSKHDGHFYYLNCFHSYITGKNLKKHEKVCNDHDYYVEMSNENSKILKYNRGEKSMKVPFIIYVDLESQLEQIHSCQNNPEKLYTEKKLCIHLLSIHSLHNVHLPQRSCTQPTTNLIFTEVKTIWKGFVKT